MVIRTSSLSMSLIGGGTSHDSNDIAESTKAAFGTIPQRAPQVLEEQSQGYPRVEGVPLAQYFSWREYSSRDSKDKASVSFGRW